MMELVEEWSLVVFRRDLGGPGGERETEACRLRRDRKSRFPRRLLIQQSSEFFNSGLDYGRGGVDAREWEVGVEKGHGWYYSYRDEKSEVQWRFGRGDSEGEKEMGLNCRRCCLSIGGIPFGRYSFSTACCYASIVTLYLFGPMHSTNYRSDCVLTTTWTLLS